MTEDEIRARLEQGEKRFDEIRERLSSIGDHLEALQSLKADVQAAKESAEKAKEIIEAWGVIKTGGKFVGWVAPIIASIMGGWAAVKLGVVSVFK